MVLSKQDLIDIILGLAAKQIVFQSEAQFQFELARELEKHFAGKASILLEVYSNSAQKVKADGKPCNKKEYTDIMISDGNSYIPIELKYKTKTATYQGMLNNKPVDVTLLDHSAIDLGSYDFLFDLYRIEQLAFKGIRPELNNALGCTFQKGFAIILTNDKSYWEKRASAAKYKDFLLHEGDSIPKAKGKDLVWIDKPQKNIPIANSYTYNWLDYAKDFKFLILEIPLKT